MSITRAAALLPLVLLVAFVLPTTAHGDLLINAHSSSLILTDHWNFYHAIADEPTAVYPTGLSGGPYGPLFYYPMAAWLFVLDALHLIDVDSWSPTDVSPLTTLPVILLLKLPNLLVYFATALVLLRIGGRRRGESTALLWLASPAVVLFTLMMGQNDGWTALTVLAAYWFGLRAIESNDGGGRWWPWLAMVALAAGGAIKLTPVLMVLPFAWVLGRDYRERALLAAAGFGAFLLLVAPFLATDYFWDHGLFGRQEGQQPGVSFEVAGVLYAGVVALVVAATHRDHERARGLVFALVAVHALIFLLGGWSPQRAVLFIGVLCAAVPVRREFLAPYALITVYSLLRALEHGNEIASWLFEPLTARVRLIPPLIEPGEIEPWHSLLLCAAGAAWVLAIASLWSEWRLSWTKLRPVWAIAPLGVAGLVVYLAATFAPLPEGIDSQPYQEPAAPEAVAAGQPFSFIFVAAHDDLRSVAFVVEEGRAEAAVIVEDERGSRLFDGTLELVEGTNRVELGRIAESGRRAYTVTVAPEGPVRFAMAAVPSELALSSASLDGRPVAGTASYSTYHETTWGALLDDAGAGLRQEWPWLVAALALVAAGMAFIAMRNPGTEDP